jgi:hypothetical protein
VGARVTLVAAVAMIAGGAHAQPVPGLAPTLTLELTCDGRGVYQEKHSDDNGTIGNVLDDRDYDKRVETQGRVRLRFADGGGAMRMSATLPGGGDRWIGLSKVEIGDDTIRARFRGGLVTVDRRSAEIEMVGGLAFSGVCQKAEPESQARKF